MDERYFLSCTNCPRALRGEYAQIHVNGDSISTVYRSAYGKVYNDWGYKSVVGAKSSLSRFIGVKAKWEKGKYPSQ